MADVYTARRLFEKISRVEHYCGRYVPMPISVFDMYLDLRSRTRRSPDCLHFIESRSGRRHVRVDGMLSGTILEPKRLIVQTWRSANWPSEAIDSVLILSFWPDKDGARIELVHVNVPEEDFAGVSQGWEKYYWTPWRAYVDMLGNRLVPE